MESFDTVLGPSAGWAALGVGAYLVVGLVAALAAQRGSRPRRWADRLLLLYPPIARASLRAAAVALVGVGAAGPATSASAAAPGDGGPPRPPVVAPARPGAEPLDWPKLTPGPRPEHSPRPVRSPATYVTVRPGDCLWSLATRSLGPDAAPTAVAATWPRWWAANRDVLGDDPDLLQPGQRLRVPPAKERSAS